jgi:ribose transport system ATP-binding protein
MAGEGKCVLLVSTEEEELLQLTDRIVVFNNGRCAAESFRTKDMSVELLRMKALSEGA